MSQTLARYVVTIALDDHANEQAFERVGDRLIDENDALKDRLLDATLATFRGLPLDLVELLDVDVEEPTRGKPSIDEPLRRLLRAVMAVETLSFNDRPARWSALMRELTLTRSALGEVWPR